MNCTCVFNPRNASQRPEFWLAEAEFNLPPITSLCLHLPSLQYRRVDEIYGGRASRAEQGEARGDEGSSRGGVDECVSAQPDTDWNLYE